MDEHGASIPPGEDGDDQAVHEEVGELADGRTIRYFTWEGEE
ncbi:hypothetical protein [Actinomycetospora flava]|uniref:Uncharacterized protein n=1 Tax=Actinomycetospora flava TaxID=3129232 RepID=A0ABU8M4G5_9PSEU